MADESEAHSGMDGNSEIKVTVENELRSMGDIAKALDPLSRDTGAVDRVLTWVNQRYGRILPGRSTSARREQTELNGDQQSAAPGKTESVSQYSSLADLFAAADPSTEADKALVVAYWLQALQNNADWTGFMVNSELKHLGHGIGNITTAVESLISQKPQLAIQTRKSGKSKQARKLYRLTAEGLKQVRQMLAHSEAETHPE